LQLPPNTTWQMLRDKFQDAGEVKFAEMRGADMGMVRFASEWDAERAVSILFKTKTNILTFVRNKIVWPFSSFFFLLFLWIINYKIYIIKKKKINHNYYLFINFIILFIITLKKLCCTIEFSLIITISYDESIAYWWQNNWCASLLKMEG